MQWLKNALFESDPTKKTEDEPATVAQVPTAAIATTASSNVLANPVYVTVPTPTDSDNAALYERLADKSSFEVTPAGTLVTKYLRGMEGLPLDENIKVQTAIKQAKAIDGLTDNDVFVAFDAMTHALASEQAKFEEASKTVEYNSVTARQEQIEQMKTDIESKQAELIALQQSLATVSSELLEQQMRVSRTKAEFEAAVQRRTAEIARERARYTSLLNG